jgi:hypothetical protein
MDRSFGSVANHSWFLPVLLVVVSAVTSCEFACITPFAAFAVATVYALSMRPALFTVAAVWLANQAVALPFSAILGPLTRSCGV